MTDSIRFRNYGQLERYARNLQKTKNLAKLASMEMAAKDGGYRSLRHAQESLLPKGESERPFITPVPNWARFRVEWDTDLRVNSASVPGRQVLYYETEEELLAVISDVLALWPWQERVWGEDIAQLSIPALSITLRFGCRGGARTPFVRLSEESGRRLEKQLGGDAVVDYARLHNLHKRMAEARLRRQDDMPTTFPFYRDSWLKDLETSDGTRLLNFGWHLGNESFLTSSAERSAVSLYSGGALSGKTSALMFTVMDFMVREPETELHIIDSKQSGDWRHLKAFTASGMIANSIVDYAIVIAELWLELESRRQKQRSCEYAQDGTSAQNPLLLVIDELPELCRVLRFDMESENEGSPAWAFLELLRDGRRHGIHVLMAAAQPDSGNVPSRIRTRILSHIVLRTDLRSHSLYLLDSEVAYEIGRGQFHQDGSRNEQRGLAYWESKHDRIRFPLVQPMFMLYELIRHGVRPIEGWVFTPRSADCSEEAQRGMRAGQTLPERLQHEVKAHREFDGQAQAWLSGMSEKPFDSRQPTLSRFEKVRAQANEKDDPKERQMLVFTAIRELIKTVSAR